MRCSTAARAPHVQALVGTARDLGARRLADHAARSVRHGALGDASR
ncbi:hypothetical protein ACF1G0_19090 [Streptomyces sp. NPDC013953]